MTRMVGVSTRWWLVGGALVGCSVWQHLIARSTDPSAAAFVASQLVAGAVYLAAAYWVVKRGVDVPLRYVLAVGVLCRLILLPSPILFDDDAYRYLWDGRVVANGINPYLHPPESLDLFELRDDNWANVGYRSVRTIYPPGAQALFGLMYACGLKTVFAFKSVFLLFDVANMLLICALLGRLGLRRGWMLIYAWSPLAAKEFANSGHVEPVMLFFLLLAFYLWLRRRPSAGWAGVSFGAAILFKLVPLALVPIAWRLGKWRSAGCALLLILLCYLPFISSLQVSYLEGLALVFSGASVYSTYWNFNGGAFSLIAALLPALSVSTAKVLVAVGVGMYSVYVATRKGVGAIPGTRNVLAACVLLSPVINPWYVCWLLPFLALRPSGGLLLLTVTCNLAYLYYGDLTFPIWIPVVEFAPVYIVLAWEVYRGRMQRRQKAVS